MPFAFLPLKPFDSPSIVLTHDFPHVYESWRLSFLDLIWVGVPCLFSAQATFSRTNYRIKIIPPIIGNPLNEEARVISVEEFVVQIEKFEM
jgi:hypothetical protein